MQIMGFFFQITRLVFKTIYFQSTFADILKKPTVLYVNKAGHVFKHFEIFKFRPKMNMTNTRNCLCVFKTNQQIENKLDKNLFTVY